MILKHIIFFLLQIRKIPIQSCPVFPEFYADFLLENGNTYGVGIYEMSFIVGGVLFIAIMFQVLYLLLIPAFQRNNQAHLPIYLRQSYKADEKTYRRKHQILRNII